MIDAIHAHVSDASAATLAHRLEAIDWQRLMTDLNTHSYKEPPACWHI